MEILFITLLVFSGRPNPVCQIDSSDPAFSKINAMLPAPPGGHIKGGLGYQGFIVKHVIESQERIISIPKDSDRTLEKLLLTSCNFDESLKTWLMSEMN